MRHPARYLALTAVLTLLTGPVAVAQQDGVGQIHTDCAAISNIAGKVMELRQIDVPLSVAMEDVAKGRPGLAGIILEAYREPRMSSQESKDVMINEFTSRYYLVCSDHLHAQ